MTYRNQLLGLLLTLFLILGCSPKKTEESTQKVIDYTTGKTQVDTYQQLKKQIRTIHQEETRQFDEATK